MRAAAGAGGRGAGGGSGANIATDKAARHEMLRRILRTRSIGSQQELREELSRAGISVTSATISRDIAEMGLVRGRDAAGRAAWRLPEAEHLGWMLSELVSGVEAVGNMVIVKCSNGTAQGVAAALDTMGWQEAAGTVAGDDTILIVARGEEAAQALVRRISERA